jgi:hypothetical protein
MTNKRTKIKPRPLDSTRVLTQDDLRIAINRLCLRISNEHCSQAEYDLMEIELATLQSRLVTRPQDHQPVARIKV